MKKALKVENLAEQVLNNKIYLDNFNALKSKNLFV